MEIAVLVDAFPRESQAFILNQVIGLLKRGHEVTVYSTGKPDNNDIARTQQDLIDRTVYTPIPSDRKQRILRSSRLFIRGLQQSPVTILKACNAARFGRDALSLRPLYRVVPMLGESFDVVHAHFGPNGRIAAIMKQLGIPGAFITTFHGFGVRQAQDHPERYSKVFTVCDQLIANSEYIYQKLLDIGIDERKLSINYNGIDVGKFPFRWSDPLETLPEPVKLITVARLEDVKGINYSLRAVAQLQEKRAERVEYHVVGDGSKRSDLESLASELGISSTVTFHDHKHREAVKRLLANSHLFILPSREETFGMVLLEAQAIGLPIVATDVGGVSEAVNNPNSATLVEPENPDAIATALNRYLENPVEWRRFGLAGRNFVKEYYSTSNSNDNLENIYASLISS